MKENNNKLYVIIVSLFVFTIVCGIIIFINMNKSKNKNLVGNGDSNIEEKADSNQSEENYANIDIHTQKEINESLKDTVLFAKKGNSIVAVDSNGNETIIYDFSNYSKRTDFLYYYDTTLQLIYLNILSTFEDGSYKNEIASIDVSSGATDFELNILKDVSNYGRGVSAGCITRLGKYIYFSPNGTDLYEMNLYNNDIGKTSISSNGHVLNVFSYSDNILIYNDGKTIYQYDTQSDSEKIIAENSGIEDLYKNELIYTNYDEKYTYFSYNLDNGNLKKISEPTFGGMVGRSNVTPYKDSYLSFVGNAIYYDNNKEFVFSCDTIGIEECSTVDILSNIIYSDKLLVIVVIDNVSIHNRGNFSPSYGAVIYDLIDHKVTYSERFNSLNNSYLYYYITYIK